MNFDGAFRGLRNPLESWNKSDSFYVVGSEYPGELDEVAMAWMNYENELREKEGKPPFAEDSDSWFIVLEKYIDWLIETGHIAYYPETDCEELFAIGPKDLDLAQRMIRAGSSDRKFLRQIMVCVDITAPLYWWKEMDTYKVSTVANSTSTMHKLASTPITKECFEMGDFNEDMMMYEQDPYNPDIYMSEYWDMFINDLEYLRKKYNETKDQKYWKELIRLLPESWLQTRTWTANYEILRNIYSQRKNHRLSEWHTFCDWIKTLPYAGELILHNLD